MTFNHAKQIPLNKANSKHKVLLRENLLSSNTLSHNDVTTEVLQPNLKSNFNTKIDDPTCESQVILK